MSKCSPVLFLIFNRPDTTRCVFEAIRAARPPRLYVAADGPRPTRAGEADRCAAALAIATAVDWPCELHTLIRTENLGCKKAVSSALDWFFEQEPEGIVLEDDCLPDASFFPYCAELLNQHRDDDRVMSISGDNFISGTWTPDASYYFSEHPHIWGWATWRRAWRHYDVAMRDWSIQDKRAFVDRIFPDTPRVADQWLLHFDQVASGQIDTWDFQWSYACWKHQGLSCIPKSNLISNIGFGPEATHTVSPESRLANLAVASLSEPLTHPAVVEVNEFADGWTRRELLDKLGVKAAPAPRWQSAARRAFRGVQRMLRGDTA